jgi:hypothetical protein
VVVLVSGWLERVGLGGRGLLVVAGAAVVDERASGEEGGGSHCRGWDFRV